MATKKTDAGEELNLSIIIVTYNNENCIFNCLKSIFAANSFCKIEIIVIDNNSHDDTIPIIKSKFPSVIIQSNTKNFGFAHAVNQGLRRARANNFLLVNSDVTINKDALESILKHCEDDGKSHIFSPLIKNKDETLQHTAFGKFPTFSIFAAEFLLPYALSKRLLFKTIFPQPGFEETFTYEWLSGACLAFTRAAYACIGPFDERFFMYFEDIDFCKRATAHGIFPKLLHDISVFHSGGESFTYDHGAAVRQGYIKKSLYCYIDKYFSEIPRNILKLFWNIGAGLRWIQKKTTRLSALC